MELARQSGGRAAELFRDIRAAAESGWDFGSRWFEDGQTRASIDTTEIVPVDLNSLLFGLENAIRAGCERRGDMPPARGNSRIARSAGARPSTAISGMKPQGAYFDYRWTQQLPVQRCLAATLYPLFAGAASDAQAAAVARTTIRELLKPGGIVTTPLTTGQQWDAPNGWAPIQWIAVAGLRRYGQALLARRSPAAGTPMSSASTSRAASWSKNTMW